MKKLMINEHTKLVNEIINELSSLPNIRLFKNTTGYDKERKIHYGIPKKGGADILGWTIELLSGYDGIFHKRPIITAIEVKTGDAKLTAIQKNFIKQVQKAGGLAGVARSIEDARKIVGI